MRHPSYSKIAQLIRRREGWADDAPLPFVEEGADVYFLSHVSANGHHLLGHDAYRCTEHGLEFPGEQTGDDLCDAAIEENLRFYYPLVRPHAPRAGPPSPSPERASRLTLILHGLNERSFGKYVPWAYQIWRGTGAPVALFPLTFHVNRVLPRWGRQIPDSHARRQRVAGNENVHRFNAVISERLEAHPERFFWGGIQTYWDVVDLVRRIRSGDHPHFTADARVDLVGYSAGGYLALLLMLENHEGFFADSRAVVFESCVALRDSNLSSPYIIDLAAEIALLKFYVKHLHKYANPRLRHWMNEHSEGRWIRTFCGLEPETGRVEARLREIAPRLLGIANTKDHVMPRGAMLNALQGVHRDTGVPVLEMQLGVHESPFACQDYSERERKFISDPLDLERFGRVFEGFVEAILGLLRG